MNQQCNYGCEQQGNYQFKNGKWCCSGNVAQCPAVRQINIQKHKGKIPWNKNKTNVYTQKQIEQLRTSHLGQKAWNKGLKNWLSEESNRERIKKISGPNSSVWKGGISCEPYCVQWLDKEYKESIKQRDGYICLNPCCFKKSKKLCVHHINYNKKDCHPKNLITLCIACNSTANYNRSWYEQWYQTIINKRYY